MGVRNLRKKAQTVLKTKTKAKTTARKKAQTPNQKAFTKESNRIKKFISRAQKRGYEFPKSVLSLLEKPKQVRKSRIDKLKSLSATELYKKATFTDPVTGEVMTGTEGRKLERSLSAKKGWKKRKSNVSRETPEVKTSSMTGRKMSEGVMRNPEIATLNYIIHSLESFAARANRKEQPLRLLNFLENAISQYGKSAVAQTIMDMDTPIPQGYDLYNEQRVTEYLNDFMFSLKRLGYADMESILEISELKDEMQIADYDLESNKFNK